MVKNNLIEVISSTSIIQNNNFNNFIKSHNLINRVYDMLYYFYFFKSKLKDYSIYKIKGEILNSLTTLEGIETYAKYFDDKLKKYRNNVELRCNLRELIKDLDYLKQYVSK